jgi:amino acid adenylation domain-containing protein
MPLQSADNFGQPRRYDQPQPTNRFEVFPATALEQAIPARFAQQVARYPDRVALHTRHQTLTYTALHDAAKRLTHGLLAVRGALHEPVAFFCESDADQIVTILGVLQAGKIALPVVPALPPALLTTLLAEAQPGLVLTTPACLALAEAVAPAGVQVWPIETLSASGTLEHPTVSLTPDTLAFISYTSGSTGVPKGVTYTHRSLLHITMRETNRLHLCADDRLLFVGARGQQMFRALLNGSTVYPVSFSEDSLQTLAAWMQQEAITVYIGIPSAFRTFVRALTGDEQFAHLRLIRLFGEPLLPADVALYKRHFPPSCLLVNTLGAVEAGGSIRNFFVDHHTAITGQVVPVGYPETDIDVAILDEAGREVGAQQPGEIVITSRYLSPGYWRRPDLTQAAFQATSEGSEVRLYRTGDVGYLLPDGCLVHLGRQDQRVKIRGSQVDLHAIEMALCALDAIHDAVVVAHAEATGHARLVAYCVPASSELPTVSALRHALMARLPAALLPSMFIMLAALPLTATGKVDRQALPAPEHTRPHLDVPYVAPRTTFEEALAQVWADLLGCDRVGVDDPFLELGGDSLLAAQLIARVRDLWQVELPLHTLLAAPTVADMALLMLQDLASRTAPTTLAQFLDEAESV